MENSVFHHVPPDILRMLLNNYLPRWMQLICRMTCVAFRNAVPPYIRSALRDLTLMNMLIGHHGELPLVEWAYSQGAPINRFLAPRLASESASGPLLDWLEKHCVQFGEAQCESAAQAGNLRAVQWFDSRKQPFRIEAATRGAIIGGHINILEWLLPLIATPRISEHSLMGLAIHGHLDVLRWLHEKHQLIDGRELMFIGYRAAHTSHLYIIEWTLSVSATLLTPEDIQMFENGLLRIGLKFGHLNLVKYLFRVRSFSAEEVYLQKRAIKRGHMHILEWLHTERKGPWYDKCIFWAAMGGYFEILKWLRQNGAPWGDEYIRIAMSIRQSGIPGLIDWAREDGCPGL